MSSAMVSLTAAELKDFNQVVYKEEKPVEVAMKCFKNQRPLLNGPWIVLFNTLKGAPAGNDIFLKTCASEIPKFCDAKVLVVLWESMKQLLQDGKHKAAMEMSLGAYMNASDFYATPGYLSDEMNANGAMCFVNKRLMSTKHADGAVKSAIAAAESERDQLKGEKGKLEKKLKEAEVKVQEAEQAAKTAQKDLQEAKDGASDAARSAQTVLDALTKEKGDLENQLSALKNAASTGADQQQAGQVLATMQKELSEAKKELRPLREELDSANEERDEAKKELSAAEVVVDQLKEELKAARAEAKDEKAAQEPLKAELQRMTDELNEEKRKMNAAEAASAIAVTGATSGQQSNEVAQLTAKLAEAEKRASESAGWTMKWGDEIIDTTKEAREFFGTGKDEKKKMLVIRAKCGEIMVFHKKIYVDDLVTELRSTENAIEDLRDQEATSKEKIAQLEKDLAKARSDSGDESRIKELKEKILSLEALDDAREESLTLSRRQGKALRGLLETAHIDYDHVLQSLR